MNYLNKIIDGKAHASAFLGKLTEEVLLLKNFGVIPKLVVVLVGDDPASVVYVRNKVTNAKAIGILSEVLYLPDSITEGELQFIISQLNEDRDVHGIIIQMPLPEHINPLNMLSSIETYKDVDGFHPYNVGLLQIGYREGFIPCTPLGCLYLLKQYLGDISGMNAVVIGRSQIVGRPAAALLLNENCSVTICHSLTQNLSDITQKADIVISAIGRPEVLGSQYFNEKATVLDVGITRIETGGKARLMGDVKFAEVIQKVRYLTPVPGGVGPMTVAFLLSNTVKAARRRLI